ncbi:hypothetical protein GGI11_000376 [Coemansia sp. RSA 2049]|nr:hypothetical protein GGI11_000376 [Coemansia sp. RSA 2049]KAJ2614995.1 hypothetical protein EV177_001783 [Coemansia sp. RSA 1804]
METLRSSVQVYAPEGVRYSINDVITAYIVIVVAQAKEKAAADWWSKPVPSILSTISGGAFGRPSDLVGIVYVNIRPRVSVENADKYLGTMSFGKGIVFPQGTLPKSPNNEAVSTLALQIRKIISSMDEQYLGQYVHLVNSHPDNYMRQTIGLFKQRNKLMVSNHSRFEHYSVDFGAGAPTLVRHTPHAFSDLVYVMPANPTRGGYEVEFNMAPDVAINIICNNKWMKLADKFDSYL